MEPVATAPAAAPDLVERVGMKTEPTIADKVMQEIRAGGAVLCQECSGIYFSNNIPELRGLHLVPKKKKGWNCADKFSVMDEKGRFVLDRGRPVVIEGINIDVLPSDYCPGCHASFTDYC